MKLKNRFVRSATYEAMANLDEKATDQMITVCKMLEQRGMNAVEMSGGPLSGNPT